MALILIANGPMQTTARFAYVSTGTSIKTMLQVKPSATKVAKVKAWGFSFDAALSSAGSVELIETDVAATVTASVAADITKLDGDALMCGDVTTNLIQVGTTSTGYTSTGEGSITSVRNLDGPKSIAPNMNTLYEHEYPLGEEPVIQISKFMRIRVHFGTSVNFYGWVKLII